MKCFKTVVFVLLIMLGLLTGCSCQEKNDKPEISPTAKLQESREIVEESTIIISVTNYNEENEEGTVTFVMPDIVKIRSHFSEANQENNITEEEINEFMRNNSTNPEYMTEYTMNVSVKKAEDGWEFLDQEALDAALLEQSNSVIGMVLDEMDTVELEEIPSIKEN